MTRWTTTLFLTAVLLLGLQSIGQPKRDKDTTAFQKFDSVEHYKIVQRTSIINAIDYRSHLLLSEIYFYKPDNKTVKFKYFFGGISFTGATNYKRQELIDYCELIKRIRDTTIFNSKGHMTVNARVLKYGKIYIIVDGYEYIYKDDTVAIQINYYKNGKYVGNTLVKDKIFQADSSQKQTASQPQTDSLKKKEKIPQGYYGKILKDKDGKPYSGKKYIYSKDGILTQIAVYKDGWYIGDAIIEQENKSASDSLQKQTASQPKTVAPNTTITSTQTERPLFISNLFRKNDRKVITTKKYYQSGKVKSIKKEYCFHKIILEGGDGRPKSVFKVYKIKTVEWDEKGKKTKHKERFNPPFVLGRDYKN